MFSGNEVLFGGMGTLNGHPVMVVARAVDGGHHGHDLFRVRCFAGGQMVYSAEGALIRGQIRIESFKHDD